MCAPLSDMADPAPGIDDSDGMLGAVSGRPLRSREELVARTRKAGGARIGHDGPLRLGQAPHVRRLSLGGDRDPIGHNELVGGVVHIRTCLNHPSEDTCRRA